MRYVRWADSARRLLVAIAAVATGIVSLQYAVIPGLGLIGGHLTPRGARTFGVFALGLLGSFALQTLAAIRPRSLVAAMGSAVTVGVLVIWGLSAQPGSPPRLLLHLAAILCLVVVVMDVIQAVVSRRLPLLWTLPALMLGFAMGFLAGGLIGLHIVTQHCRFSLLGPEISSILCSG